MILSSLNIQVFSEIMRCTVQNSVNPFVYVYASSTILCAECQFLRSDIDECASNPCVSGACTDGENHWECTCESGWTGQHCEIGNFGLIENANLLMQQLDLA